MALLIWEAEALAGTHIIAIETHPGQESVRERLLCLRAQVLELTELQLLCPRLVLESQVYLATSPGLQWLAGPCLA